MGGIILPLGGVSQFNTPIDDIELWKFVLTPAQVQALTTAFTTLIPAPGAGFAQIITEAEVYMEALAGSVAYATGTGSVNLAYQNGTAIATIATGNMVQARSLYTRVGAGSSVSTLYPIESDARNGLGIQNAAIGLELSTGVSYTAGTMPIFVTLRTRLTAMRG